MTVCTAEVGTGTQVSDFPTNRELVSDPASTRIPRRATELLRSAHHLYRRYDKSQPSPNCYAFPRSHSSASKRRCKSSHLCPAPARAQAQVHL